MNLSDYNIEITGLTKDGFDVPAGYRMEKTILKGNRDGVAIVWNENNQKFAELCYKNDELNGLCKFHTSKDTIVMVPFEDNIIHGILRENVKGEDTKWIVYEYGDIRATLERNKEMVGYMSKYDTNGNLLMICQYDSDYRMNGKCYKYLENKIIRISTYDNNKLCRNKTISFEKGKRCEYEIKDGNEMKIYDGDYEDDILNDYPRNGKGTLYKDDHIIIYDGYWLKGIPHGKGECYFYEQDVRVKSYKGTWNHGELLIDNCISLKYVNNEIIKMISMSIHNDSDLLNLLKNTAYNLKDTISELIIEENCCNNIKSEINLCNFTCLERILIKKNSLRLVKTLKICNNPKLQSIEIEDGIVENRMFKECSFYHVNDVEFISMVILN